MPGYSILTSTNIPNVGGMFVILAPFDERAGHPELSANQVAARLRQQYREKITVRAHAIARLGDALGRSRAVVAVGDIEGGQRVDGVRERGDREIVGDHPKLMAHAIVGRDINLRRVCGGTREHRIDLGRSRIGEHHGAGLRLHGFDLALFEKADSLVQRFDSADRGHDFLANIEADLREFENKLDERTNMLLGIK